MVTDDYIDVVKKMSYWHNLDPGYQVYSIYFDDRNEQISIYFNTRSKNNGYMPYLFQVKQLLYDILSQYPYYIEKRKKLERFTKQEHEHIYNYFI